MKSDEYKSVKTFDSVEYFKVKEQLAKELLSKSFAEQKEFIHKVLSGEIIFKLKS